MTTAQLIACVVSISISAFVYIKVFPLFCAVEKFCDTLLTPVNRLCDLFASRKSFLGNNKIIRLIVVIGVFMMSVYYIVSSFLQGVDYVSLITSLLGGNALLGLMDLMLKGFGPKDYQTYAAIVSIGISSFLSFLYMRCTVETLEETQLPKALKFFFVVLFNVLFILVSFFLSDWIILWCNNTAAYLIRIYHQLVAFFTTGSLNFGLLMQAVFTGLIFLALLYVAFNAFVITFREILATVMYGIFALGLQLVIQIPIMMIPDFPPAITSLLGTIALFIPDYLRANEKVKDSFTRFIYRLGGARY